MSDEASSEGFTGGCLCNAVRYRSEKAPVVVAHCQCVDCRKSSGSGHCTHVVVPADGFSASGQIKLYSRPADSGNMTNRGFCPDCGAPVYSTNDAMPHLAFVRASSLDNPEAVTPSMVVFASRAVSWDIVDTGLPAYARHPGGSPGKTIAAQMEGLPHGL